MRDSEAASADSFQAPSNPAILLISGAGIVVFGVLARWDEAGRGLVAALSLCAVLCVGIILRRYAGRVAFWVGLCAMALAHILLVLLAPWPRSLDGPGIVFAPLVILDMYAWARLLLWLARGQASS